MKRFLLVLAALAATCVLAATETKPVVPPRLDVTTQPEGARVFVDGTLRGRAPCSFFDLKPGTHHLRLEADSRIGQDAFVKLAEGEYVQKNFELAEEKALILVKTTPAGVDVKCNGLSLGQTPLLITSLASSRTHTLELSLNGYQTKKIDVLSEGRHPLVREETLSLDSGIVSCTSEPEGATVIVNGVERGVTPIEISKVPKGLATFTFKLAGYGDETRELRMVPGDRQTLSIQMKGKAGRLQVVSTPEGARVFVDNDFQGKTPVMLSKVQPGTHDIRVELEGYAPLTRSVQVDNAAEATEEFALESILGRLEVITSPPGARVTIDGRPVGVTVSQGDSPKSKVLAVENVTAGEHAVVVHCQGFADKGYKVTVRSRETAQLFSRLARIFTPDTLVDTVNGQIKGVLVEKDPLGNIKLETTPGVQRFIPVDDIRKITTLVK